MSQQRWNVASEEKNTPGFDETHVVGKQFPEAGGADRRPVRGGVMAGQEGGEINRVWLGTGCAKETLQKRALRS